MAGEAHGIVQASGATLSFARTGCAITITGDYDNEIQYPGASGFKADKPDKAIHTVEKAAPIPSRRTRAANKKPKKPRKPRKPCKLQQPRKPSKKADGVEGKAKEAKNKVKEKAAEKKKGEEEGRKEGGEEDETKSEKVESSEEEPSQDDFSSESEVGWAQGKIKKFFTNPRTTKDATSSLLPRAFERELPYASRTRLGRRSGASKSKQLGLAEVR